MTARSITVPPSSRPTRVFLIERFDQLAIRIEQTLLNDTHGIGMERASNIPAAATDLTFLDADYVVVNVDEMKPDEWQTLSEMRRTYPTYHFYGLSDDPQSQSRGPEAQQACERVFPLTTDLADLKQELTGRGR